MKKSEEKVKKSESEKWKKWNYEEVKKSEGKGRGFSEENAFVYKGNVERSRGLSEEKWRQN